MESNSLGINAHVGSTCEAQNKRDFEDLAMCPGPSTFDLISADRQKLPNALVEKAPRYLGSDDIGYERYISPDIFAAEMRSLWPKVWQWVCREEQISKAGDYVTYDIGPYSFIVICGDGGTIRAFYNACLHRGTQLRASGSSGSVAALRCKFHGWTWNIDGTLKQVPCRWDFPHVADEVFKLPEIRVDKWGGFIFINMDPGAPALEQYLGVLPNHFQGRLGLGSS